MRHLRIFFLVLLIVGIVFNQATSGQPGFWIMLIGAIGLSGYYIKTKGLRGSMSHVYTITFVFGLAMGAASWHDLGLWLMLVGAVGGIAGSIKTRGVWNSRFLIYTCVWTFIFITWLIISCPCLDYVNQMALELPSLGFGIASAILLFGYTKTESR